MKRKRYEIFTISSNRFFNSFDIEGEELKNNDIDNIKAHLLKNAEYKFIANGIDGSSYYRCFYRGIADYDIHVFEVNPEKEAYLVRNTWGDQEVIKSCETFEEACKEAFIHSPKGSSLYSRDKDIWIMAPYEMIGIQRVEV